MEHQLITLENGYLTCKTCQHLWKRFPGYRSCPGVRWYHWESSPPHLKTYSQLRSLRLKPRDRKIADGVIMVKENWCWLYNEREAVARRQCSERQLIVLANARQRLREKWKCEHCHYEPTNPAQIHHHFALPGLCLDCQKHIEHESMINGDRLEAIEWAQSLLARNDWALLDTETTSLDGLPVEIAIIAPDGTVLFNSLVNPGIPISPGAHAIHGITDEELATAPTIPQVWPTILEALAGRSSILAYNANFDETVMWRAAQWNQLPELTQQWECIMEPYAAFCGDWSEYHGNYRWQLLPGAGHRALDDCLAALRTLQAMAHTDHDEE